MAPVTFRTSGATWRAPALLLLLVGQVSTGSAAPGSDWRAPVPSGYAYAPVEAPDAVPTKPPMRFVPLSVGAIFLVLPVFDPSIAPDPGDTANSGLDEPDVDSDGVRDDIERYIAQEYRSEPRKVRETLYYYARFIGRFIVEFPTAAGTADRWRHLVRAHKCLESIKPQDADFGIDELQARYLNTYDRSVAYLQASRVVPRSVITGGIPSC